MVRSLLCSLVLLCSLLPGTARSGEEERVAGPLVVYSDDLMFVVKEPEGWKGDVEQAPKIQAGVVLYRETETFEKNTALIAVRVARKVDENTREDLGHEMKGFREFYPDAEFGDLKVKHPAYRSFSRIFSVPKSRYEYVTFLNPGKKTPFLFSVVMNTGSRKARKEELTAYREVVRSLEYISQEGVKPPERPVTNK